jgi:hypothetical protein
MIKKTAITLFPLLLSCAAIAGEPLNADDVKALFTNKTFDIHNVINDKNLKGFDSADGVHLIYIPWKDKTSKRKWWIEGNKHCTSHPKNGDSCKDIINIGEGVYHGITDGKHTHTLSNFRDGNQL